MHAENFVIICVKNYFLVIVLGMWMTNSDGDSERRAAAQYSTSCDPPPSFDTVYYTCWSLSPTIYNIYHVEHLMDWKRSCFISMHYYSKESWQFLRDSSCQCFVLERIFVLRCSHIRWLMWSGAKKLRKMGIDWDFDVQLGNTWLWAR